MNVEHTSIKFCNACGETVAGYKDRSGSVRCLHCGTMRRPVPTPEDHAAPKVSPLSARQSLRLASLWRHAAGMAIRLYDAELSPEDHAHAEIIVGAVMLRHDVPAMEHVMAMGKLPVEAEFVANELSSILYDIQDILDIEF